MVFIESGLVAPLFAEVACGGPAECHRRGSKDHGADQRKGALLKSDGVDISPCEGEADHDQSDAPAGGWRAGDLLLSGGLLAGLDEGERPGDPAGKQLDKGGNVKHGLDFNRGEGEATREKIFEVACPDCGAMLRIDATTGLVVSHTPAPRKRMFEDLETAAQAMRAQDERKESLFRQGVEAEKNKEDLFEKKFAEALRKAKDGPQGKPLREFDLD